jgi:hypothetical protein
MLVLADTTFKKINLNREEQNWSILKNEAMEKKIMQMPGKTNRSIKRN